MPVKKKMLSLERLEITGRHEQYRNEILGEFYLSLWNLEILPARLRFLSLKGWNSLEAFKQSERMKMSGGRGDRPVVKRHLYL